MVYSLYRSDLLVLAIPFQALTGPIFSYLWNPFPTSYTDFRLGIPRFRVLGPISDRKLHITSWSSRRQVGAPSLDYSATGPPSHDRYGQHCSSFRISTTGRDQSPCPIMSSCGLLFYCFNLTCYGQSAINDTVEVGLVSVYSEVFSLSVGSRILVAPEPVLADALPYLSNSGIIRNVI